MMWYIGRLGEHTHVPVNRSKEYWSSTGPVPSPPSSEPTHNSYKRQSPPAHTIRTPIPIKQHCWGDCQVCGDRATGKHYGVIACEGCKGFFKRSVRKKLIYTCRAKGNCVIDKIQRNRCQRCRLEKCFKTGMNQDAVQCERKPLMTSPASSPANQIKVLEASSKCYHVTESSPTEISMPVTPPSSIPDVASPTATTTFSILGPQHAEFKLYIPSLAVPDFSMDYIYEFATRLLFVTVDWCRSISSFRSLTKADQVVLLQKSWPELFLLGVVQLIEKFPFSPLFAYAANDLKKKENDDSHDNVYHRTQQSSFNNIMTVKNFVFSMARMEMDPMEFAFVKAIVLFNSDPRIPVADPKCIENLQEQTHCAFKRHIDTAYPSQPERFARILLKLPSIRAIDRPVVEELFFVPLIGTVRIADIMNNIISQTQEF